MARWRSVDIFQHQRYYHLKSPQKPFRSSRDSDGGHHLLSPKSESFQPSTTARVHLYHTCSTNRISINQFLANMEIPRNIKRETRAAKNKLFSKMFDSPTSNASLLHGMLHIKIVSCTKLRNFDRVGNVS